MSNGKELIQTLKIQAGGLNWFDEEPAPSEFKALKGWVYDQGVLVAQMGAEAATTYGINRLYNANKFVIDHDDDSSTRLEYTTFVDLGMPYAMKIAGTATTTMAVTSPAQILDLSDAAVTIADYENQIPDEVEGVQVGQKVLMFCGNGVNGKNLVLEYDNTKTADFKARSMGITEPTIRATVTVQGSGDLTANWQYYWTWVRLDANGNKLSESAANTAAGFATPYSEIDSEDFLNVLVSLAGAGSTTTDPQVTHARIYRTLNVENANNAAKDGTYKFYKLADLGVVFTAGVGAATTGYSDTTTDENLLADSLFDILLGEYHTPFPPCRHGTYAKGRTWCSDGDNVYFSNGDPRGSAPETYDQRFSYLVTGENGEKVRCMFTYDDNVVVVMDNRTGVILNSDPDNAIKWTDEDIGSLYKPTFAKTPFGMMALTNKGVRVHDGYRWGPDNLSEKVIKLNEFDRSRRVMPPYALSKTEMVARAFWYEGRYYLRINGEDTGRGPQNVCLVYDPKFGWSESDIDFDVVIKYANESKAIALQTDVVNDSAIQNLFQDTTILGDAIDGVAQPGNIKPEAGAIDIDDVSILGKLSAENKVTVKTVGSIHGTRSSVVPTPNSEILNRKFRALSAGYKTGPSMSIKLRGNIAAGDYIDAFRMKMQVMEDYDVDNIYAAGMVARYSMDSFSSNAVDDVSGNDVDLTFTYSALATISAGSTAVRGNSIKITNSAATDCGFINSTGYDIEPLSAFAIAGAFYPTGDNGDVRIFENYKNDRKIALDWLSGDEKLRLTVGTDAHTWNRTFPTAPDDWHSFILAYRYLTGTYEGADFQFQTKLYEPGVTATYDIITTDGTTTDNAVVTGSGMKLMYGATNDTWMIDEVRIYDRWLTEEEASGTLSDWYQGDDEDPQYV